MGLRRAIALRLLPAYSGGALPSLLRRWMCDVVDVDDDVAAAYDLLRRAEHRSAAAAGLSSGQQELLLRRLLDDGALDEEQTPHVAPSAGRLGMRAWWGSLAPALGAATCAFLFWALPVDDLASRGGAQAPLGVHVRCVIDGAIFDEASAGARQTGADVDCAPGGTLAFSTTNLSPRAQFAFVVGIDQSSQPVWLPPFAPSSSALAVPAGTADALLSTMARLPDAGDVTLFVLLSDVAFSGVDVEQRLNGALRAGVPLAQLERLPVDVAVQSRLIVRRPR